jgi:hypothetical protein
MVAQDLIPNKDKEYKRLGKIIADARMAGLIDWQAIEDRTRALRGNSHWDSPRHIMEVAVAGYMIDKWETQPCRVEVWIEKDALVGVIAGVCEELDLDYFSCRGYTSASEMWKAAMRMRRYIGDNQDMVVLHFGDHDPSGIDMTRDISERLDLLSYEAIEVHRVALNMDQVELYNPPPNPAKLTDSRVGAYILEYGRDSWELDALEPSVMVDLIRDQVLALRDDTPWQEALDREEEERAVLQDALDQM